MFTVKFLLLWRHLKSNHRCINAETRCAEPCFLKNLLHLTEIEKGGQIIIDFMRYSTFLPSCAGGWGQQEHCNQAVGLCLYVCLDLKLKNESTFLLDKG